MSIIINNHAGIRRSFDFHNLEPASPAFTRRERSDRFRYRERSASEISAKIYPSKLPISTHKINLRSALSRSQWDIVRKDCYKKGGKVCQVCGETGLSQERNHAVECHEEWSFDNINKVQKLIGLMCLCPRCHLSQHIGYARVSGKLNEVLSHMEKINNLSSRDVRTLVLEAEDVYAKRNKESWTVDMSYINTLYPHFELNL